MNYGKAFNQYNRSNIESAGKLELIIMCYERAILRLMQAKDYLMNGEIEKKTASLQNALDIISELQASLNLELGGEIAKGLDSLYSYIIRRITQADIQKDYPVFDECIKILSELNSSWEGILPEKEKPIQESHGSNQTIRRLSHQVAV